jgi:hypothetical protein
VQGTHDAWSLINNSPFEVEVINLPAIGPDNRYYKYFTGRTSELGVGVGGSFGIAKATRHFDLALDFLRFLTSYRINHMMMMDYCKWPPAVVKAKYEGLLEKFEPIAGDARKEVYPPFSFSGKSQTKLAEVLDRIVVDKVPDPKKYFWEQFIANLPYMIEENRNAQDDAGRRYFDLAGQCSCTSAGLLAEGLTVKRREMLEFRNAVGLENMVSRIAEEYLLTENIEAMEKLQRRDGDGGRDGIRWLSK